VTTVLRPTNSTVLNKLKLKSGLNFSDKLTSSSVASFSLNTDGVCADAIEDGTIRSYYMYCTCSRRNDVDNLITTATKVGS